MAKQKEITYSQLNQIKPVTDSQKLVFDTWKKGQSRKWERVLCGGTCFDAPTKYVNEHNFDGHIVLTDLCAPKPITSKCKRLWITTPQYAERPYFETKEIVLVVD